MGFGDPERTHNNAKWVAFTLAFSALGKQMTGLPIDFQIQQTSHANRLYLAKRRAWAFCARYSVVDVFHHRQRAGAAS